MTDDRTVTRLFGSADGDEDPARLFLIVYRDERVRTSVVPLLEGLEVTIGRLSSNAICVDDEAASRTHARVSRKGTEVIVEDLGSHNGTWVNEKRISGRVRLSPGDEVTVGPARVVLGAARRRTGGQRIGSSADLDAELDTEVERATRYRRPLALAMVRCEGCAEVVDEVLNRTAGLVRRVDYLGEYGPDEIAVILPESPRRAAEAAIRRLTHELRLAARGQAQVYAGLAAFPEDGTRSAELLANARGALRAARAGGGLEGLAVAPPSGPPAPADAVVVAPAMKRLHAMLKRVAPTPVTVLLVGETGVGKEIIAEALHGMSERASRPFVKLNCAALPGTLIESELFGHERGAFTGADRQKTGYFEAAKGGSLFLDEIGELAPEVQTKLLRVLDRRAIVRLGATGEIPVDARVICATNRDLEAAVRRGRFREDLFFRLSAFVMAVPPLRSRREEIAPLASQFARQFAGELGQPVPTFTPEALALLSSHSWPGNVRELRNAIERAVVLQRGGRIEVEHLPAGVLRGGAADVRTDTDTERSAGGPNTRQEMQEKVGEVERGMVLDALERCGGNQSRTAAAMGISRWALMRLLRKHGIETGGR